MVLLNIAWCYILLTCHIESIFYCYTLLRTTINLAFAFLNRWLSPFISNLAHILLTDGDFVQTHRKHLACNNSSWTFRQIYQRPRSAHDVAAMISLIAAPHVIESYLLLYFEYSIPYIGLSPYIAASFALSAAAYNGVSFVNAHTSEIIQPLLNGADYNIVNDYDRNATSIRSSIWSFFFGNPEYYKPLLSEVSFLQIDQFYKQFFYQLHLVIFLSLFLV